MKWVLPFGTAEYPRLEQVGGKALSLIEMTRQKLPVPPGFVLTVHFFESWLEALYVTPAWQLISDGGAEGLAEAARALQASCRALEFSTQQQ